MTPMKKKILITMASLTLIAAPISKWIPATAAAATATSQNAFVNQVVKPIYISKKSYFELVDVTLAPVDEGQIATFTLRVNNGDSTALSLLDYWYRLSNQSGTSFTLKLAGEDTKKNQVAPNSKTFVTLYANVGENTKLSDLIFTLIKFDFSTSNYERGIGKFMFPKNFTNEVKTTSYKALYFTNTTLFSKVSGSSLSSSGDDHFVSVDFVYNNTGKRAITLSKYKYYIVTSAGIFYEAQSSLSGDLTMQPQTRQEFQLTATIPSSIKASGWKLVVMRDSGGDTSTMIPVGAYQLGMAGNSAEGPVSDTFKYSTSQGSYKFNLVQLVRQPWETQDVLSARIRIQNTSSSASAPLPDITGYFYLDNQLKVDFKTVATANQFGLSPNGYVDVDVYAKLPASYKFNSVKVVVNDKKDAQIATKAGELSSSSFLSQIPTYAVDQVYNLPREGNNMNAMLNTVNIYDTTTSKVFDVQMTLTSQESRTVEPIHMVGVFVNDNGDIFPAQTSMADGKVNANNKALVHFRATVPQNYNTANLKLIVGEGVTDTKYTSGSAAADAYVGAVKYNLPQEQRLMTVMKEIPFLPFKLTINKFTPQVFGNDLELTLDYNLNKDMSYDVYPIDRKLILNIEGLNQDDGTIYTYYSQELSFEGDSATSIQPGNNTITLKKPMNYDSINGNLKFKAKIYEVVNGSKKLIAERPFYWFIENDWTQDVATPN
jgi:hypothetical protein